MLDQYTEKEYEEMFQKIKEYINSNPGKTKYEIARGTQIRVNIIDKFIKEGRLELKFGSVGISNENRSAMSNERRKELTEGLKKELEGKDDKGYIGGRISSQLVKDIKRKYGIDREDGR